MKTLLTAISALLISTVSFPQKDVKLEDVASHVGDSVRVCGKIMTARYLDRSESGPTLMNMGKPYPDQPLTIVIYKKDRKNFDLIPEVELIDKDICVTGVVILYKEKAQMVLNSKEQLVVKE